MIYYSPQNPRLSAEKLVEPTSIKSELETWNSITLLYQQNQLRTIKPIKMGNESHLQ